MAKLTRKERRKRKLKGKTAQPIVPVKKEKKTASVGIIKKEAYTGILGFFHKEYRKLLIIPFAMLALAIIVLLVTKATTGEFVDRGISLKGGVSLTVPNTVLSAVDVINHISQDYPSAEINVRILSEFGAQRGFIIDSSDLSEEELLIVLEKEIPDVRDVYSIETIGSQLGQAFTRQIITALLIAFVFMALVVFYYFRTFIPSMAVILAAASDMIVTLAVVSLLDIRLSTAGIAAFLMLIGYSVDTDILLSTKVLKRTNGTHFHRILGAAKTGFTMTLTTLGAVVVGYLVSDSEVITQIMTILIIGLLVDIINTWLQNVGILRIYCEKKNIR